jgi:hypothetical protein
MKTDQNFIFFLITFAKHACLHTCFANVQNKCTKLHLIRVKEHALLFYNNNHKIREFSDIFLYCEKRFDIILI